MDTLPFVPDQIPVAIGKVVQNVTPTQLGAAFPSKTKTPTKSFSLHYLGHTLSFTKNIPFVYDAGLLAALVAVNAPIV